MLLFAANGHYLDLKVARLLNRNKPPPWISAFTTARIDHWSRRDGAQFHLKVLLLLWPVTHGGQDRVYDLMYVYAQPAEQEETGYDIFRHKYYSCHSLFPDFHWSLSHSLLCVASIDTIEVGCECRHIVYVRKNTGPTAIYQGPALRSLTLSHAPCHPHEESLHISSFFVRRRIWRANM